MDEGGVAEAAGVAEGDCFVRLLAPTLELSELPFDAILAAIDERRDAGLVLQVVFDTAAPVRRLYAVELPARPALAAFAASSAGATEGGVEGGVAAAASTDIGGAVRALCSPPTAFVWAERSARLFVGDAVIPSDARWLAWLGWMALRDLWSTTILIRSWTRCSVGQDLLWSAMRLYLMMMAC